MGEDGGMDVHTYLIDCRYSQLEVILEHHSNFSHPSIVGERVVETDKLGIDLNGFGGNDVIDVLRLSHDVVIGTVKSSEMRI